ncbi:hypothetical protein K491DRAFT_697150 [Lophiostoma macrostomum CBS 122681]|uniref:C2H2-type domain-containing protein n=1 Tax=Lophiostoma macrostomum CBS 122681 TaxID=1314788 RepID=A0A6A6SSQ9_9PLEO|nr:hypothetical protein K491DRAFT_697150 [Lophiostoma macrostomum CBS 122681]
MAELLRPHSPRYEIVERSVAASKTGTPLSAPLGVSRPDDPLHGAPMQYFLDFFPPIAPYESKSDPRTEYTTLWSHPNLQKRRIVCNLYELTSQTFEKLLKCAKNMHSPKTSNTSNPGKDDVQHRTDISSSSTLVQLSQVQAMQQDFMRFHVWGKEFHVADGGLDRSLGRSEALRQDITSCLLHLYEALDLGLTYLSKEIIKPYVPNAVRTLETARASIKEDVYLDLVGGSFADIVDEVSIAIEGLGDLSFCLEAPAKDLSTVQQNPEITYPDSFFEPVDWSLPSMVTLAELEEVAPVELEEITPTIPEKVTPAKPYSAYARSVEESDSDYTPSRRTRSVKKSDSNYTPARTTSTRRTSLGSSAKTTQHQLKRAKRRRAPSSKALDNHLQPEQEIMHTRPFPCPLTIYGCQSSFSSKNEWKRHVSTQHIKLGFWRCDLCPTTIDTSDDRTVYHTLFNRKDLFTQHLRRMHAAPPTASKAKDEYPVNEDNLVDHLSRCYKTLRALPMKANCLFCEKPFSGLSSWDERMEHVGRHMEKEAKQNIESENDPKLEEAKGRTEPGSWRHDPELEKYYLEEGLIVRGKDGDWKVGDGRPLRTQNASAEPDVL